MILRLHAEIIAATQYYNVYDRPDTGYYNIEDYNTCTYNKLIVCAGTHTHPHHFPSTTQHPPHNAFKVT